MINKQEKIYKLLNEYKKSLEKWEILEKNIFEFSITYLKFSTY